jgi:hypothetical protein
MSQHPNNRKFTSASQKNACVKKHFPFSLLASESSENERKRIKCYFLNDNRYKNVFI